MSLKIADNLTLPLDFMTERIAFLARTGSGKSGGMRVLFEQILLAQQFAIFIDPKGDAWGIRADGTGKGMPVLVIGGDHGDIPLEAHGGKVIAEFLVKERVSTVLDISDLSTNEMWRFVADLTKTLYRLNRDVLHLFIDEADMLAGQQFYDPHCLHGIQLIQNKGRARGFGVTIATQRPQILNKTVLNASGTLIAMQTIGDDALKVVKSWLGQSADKETIAAILKDLPTMKTREAFVYSPQTLGIEPRRIKFASFTTYDSMRTPRPGEARQQPKNIADIDLTAIQRDMAETIEKAKAEDPALLKAEIARLKREAAGHVCPKVEAAEPEIREVFTEHLKLTIGSRLENIVSSLNGFEYDAAALVNRIRESVEGARHFLDNEPAEPFMPQRPMTFNPADHPTDNSAAIENLAEVMQSPSKTMQAMSGAALPEGERKCLIAIAQFTTGDHGATREQVTLLSGYKRSTRDAYIQRLGAKGYVRVDRGEVWATVEGVAALGSDYEPLPTGEALQRWWLDRLPEGEAKILRILLEVQVWFAREYISERTGYKRSTRDAYIQRLGVRRLVEVSSAGVRAVEGLS